MLFFTVIPELSKESQDCVLVESLKSLYRLEWETDSLKAVKCVHKLCHKVRKNLFELFLSRKQKSLTHFPHRHLRNENWRAVATQESKSSLFFRLNCAQTYFPFFTLFRTKETATEKIKGKKFFHNVISSNFLRFFCFFLL